MRILLKGPFTYLDDLRVNKTAYSLLIGISLTFKRQLWPEKKPIFRPEFEWKSIFKLSNIPVSLIILFWSTSTN